MNNTEALHPVNDVYDGVFNSASGNKISIINPTAEQICLKDIARGLSNICRFGGQIPYFSSVAKHTILVWYLAPDKYKQIALLHDASEAYLGDVIKPLKVLLESVYRPIEANFTKVIFEKYHLDPNLCEVVKTWDRHALEIEHAFFHKVDTRFLKIFKEIDLIIGENTPYKQFLNLLTNAFGDYDL